MMKKVRGEMEQFKEQSRPEAIAARIRSAAPNASPGRGGKKRRKVKKMTGRAVTLERDSHILPSAQISSQVLTVPMANVPGPHAITPHSHAHHAHGAHALPHPQGNGGSGIQDYVTGIVIG